MDDNKIQDLLLQLVQDMSYIKAKLNNIEEQKLSSRIDQLEGQNKEHDRIIKSLERRANTLEEFTRNKMNEQNKTHISVWIALGTSIISILLGVIM